MIVKEKVHSTETKLNVLDSLDKDGPLLKKKTKILALRLVWARHRQMTEGFCTQDHLFLSKF